MKKLKTLLGKSGVVAVATMLATAVVFAETGSGSGCTSVLTNICATDSNGKAICQAQRCPGECACCKTSGTNLSGSANLITVGGKRVYCNTWSGPCSYQPTWCSS